MYYWGRERKKTKNGKEKKGEESIWDFVWDSVKVRRFLEISMYSDSILPWEDCGESFFEYEFQKSQVGG